MNIVNKNINEIFPYKNNPRKNDKAVDFVANSIKEFGFKVPIVIDRNGTIIAGHTRYKAAKKIKMEIVPCIVADDLSEDQINAFRIVDNKVSEFSEWDFDLLTQELQNITDIDMNSFGFDFSCLNEDKVIEDPEDFQICENPKSKLGDVFLLGNHKLMCGDSTDINDVKNLWEDNWQICF